jgi:outer membrane protein TolC
VTYRKMALLLASVVAGCTSYDALPLPERAPLAPTLAGLRGASAMTPPLSLDDVVLLALQNSPDLLAVRSQRGVSQAQLLQAGLPPNPNVTGAILPLAAGVGNTVAWNAGLSYDIKSLVTLHSRHQAAAIQARSVDASLLWQEWQTVGQARLLAVDVIAGDRTLAVLRQAQDLIAGRSQRSAQALAAGNLTLATAAPDLAALQTARTAVADQTRLQLTRKHQLNALLGLVPEAPLPLAAEPDLPAFDPEAVRRDLPDITAHRPDLVALQLGYDAQDEKVRTAILQQFPNLTFGVTGGSDNSNVRNVGPQIQLELPIFDHAQGLIANERATRRQLHDEYAARLAAATGQVQALLAETALQQRQLQAAQQDLATVRRSAGFAQAALQSGNLDERSALDLISARVTKELEIANLQQALLEQQVAIDTLIGAGMPAIQIGEAP